MTQVYREGEDPVDLYTDSIACNVIGAEYGVVEEEETIVYQVVQELSDPYLETAPEASYSYFISEAILIEVGQAVDPQGVSEVQVSADLGPAEAILEFTGSSIKKRDDLSDPASPELVG